MLSGLWPSEGLKTLDLRKYTVLEFEAVIYFSGFVNLNDHTSVTNRFFLSVCTQIARSSVQKPKCRPLHANDWSYGNELVMLLHALALGKHSLFIIKPLADSRKPLHLLPRLSGMLKAVAANWFPCLPFVMGKCNELTPSINSLGTGK